MAKSHSFFGLRTGSTKTLTFQVFNGKQVTKDRVYLVKNPKTTAQMMQRACFATVSAAYSTLREICDHSFEYQEGKVANASEFVRRNVEIMRNQSKAFNPYNWKSMLPNSLVVSDGSLNMLGTVASGSKGSLETEGNIKFCQDVIEGWENLYTDGTLLEEMTWAQALNLLELQPGDQITFGQVQPYNGDADTFGGALPCQLKLARIVAPSTAEGLAKPAFVVAGDVGDIHQFANYDEASQNADLLYINHIGGQTHLGLTIPGNWTGSTYNHYGALLILSRKSNNKWKRSKCVLSANNSTDVLSGDYSMKNVVSTWSPTGELYLNNAVTRSAPANWE